MAYTINLTNGTLFTVVADGTVDNTSSMTLVGKNYAGYGEFLDENFIHLLESGANATAPGAPLVGQLWFDTNAGLLKVYNGSAFKVLTAATVSGSSPAGSVAGDLWFDTANQQLKVYNGTTWVTIGPSYTPVTGKSGAIVETLADSTATSYVVVSMYAKDTRISIFSKDQFTPVPAISGFSTIYPGLNTASTSNTVTVGSIINNNNTGVGNIGSSTGYFNTVFAKATAALYADVAERYAADNVYAPGTVVEIGGTAEVTLATAELSENVLGVVSTAPAYIMNATAGDDATHPAIALVGRVPVHCTGIIHKGDRLVCAGNGLARAATREELTPFNIIGRALTEKLTNGTGTIDAIVGIKN